MNSSARTIQVQPVPSMPGIKQWGHRMLASIQSASMKQNKTDLGTAVAQKNTEALQD